MHACNCSRVPPADRVPLELGAHGLHLCMHVWLDRRPGDRVLLVLVEHMLHHACVAGARCGCRPVWGIGGGVARHARHPAGIPWAAGVWDAVATCVGPAQVRRLRTPDPGAFDLDARGSIVQLTTLQALCIGAGVKNMCHV